MYRAETLGPMNRSKTRRVSGKRAITPIKKRHSKTRYLKKVDGVAVSVSLRASRDNGGQREKEDTKEHRDGEGGQGDQGTSSEGKWKDTQVCEALEHRGHSEDQERSVHPGSVQGLSHGSLSSESALIINANETEIEEEEAPF